MRRPLALLVACLATVTGGLDAVAQVGACCVNPGCFVSPNEACLALGGTFQGTGTTCAGDPCRPCCLPDACYSAFPAVCTAGGGTPDLTQGDVECTTVCTKACCFAGGGCMDLLPPDCQAMGGAPLAGPCASATACTGACCTAGGCFETQEPACGAAGGFFLGLRTTCAQGCLGACCFNDDSPCMENVAAAACAGLGGDFQGSGSICPAGSCRQQVQVVEYTFPLADQNVFHTQCIPIAPFDNLGNTRRLIGVQVMVDNTYGGDFSVINLNPMFPLMNANVQAFLNAPSRLVSLAPPPFDLNFGVSTFSDNPRKDSGIVCGPIGPGVKCPLGFIGGPDVLAASTPVLPQLPFEGTAIICYEIAANGSYIADADVAFDLIVTDFAVTGTLTVIYEYEPLGACCLADLTCVPRQTEVECTDAGGRFFPRQDCMDVQCVNACCIPPDQCMNLAEADCLAILGARFHFNQDCALDDPCDGACCLPGNVCMAKSLQECDQAGGLFFVLNGTCPLPDCPPVVTPCCLCDGSCMPTASPAACIALGGMPAAGASCAGVTCVPFGACCVNQMCLYPKTPQQCTAMGGVYAGDCTTSCPDCTCPTLSLNLAGTCVNPNTPGFTEITLRMSDLGGQPITSYQAFIEYDPSKLFFFSATYLSPFDNGIIVPPVANPPGKVALAAAVQPGQPGVTMDTDLATLFFFPITLENCDGSFVKFDVSGQQNLLIGPGNPPVQVKPCGLKPALVRIDGDPPRIDVCCNPVKLEADADCQAYLADYTLCDRLEFHDNCDVITKTQVPQPGTKLPLGKTWVTIIVTDCAGGSDFCQFPVFVNDNEPPVIVACPPNRQIKLDDDCVAVVPDLVPEVSATDNCDNPNLLTITQDPPAGTGIGPGNTTVLITVADDFGNADTCTVRLTAVDNKAPKLVYCPIEITLVTGPSGFAELPDLTENQLAVDNCTPLPLLIFAQAPPPGTLLPPGFHTVTITVIDEALLQDSCDILVHVMAGAALPPPDFVLQGPEATNWFAPESWSGGAVPGPGASVLILGSAIVDAPGAAALSVVVGPGGSLAIGGAGSLEASTVLVAPGAVLTLAGDAVLLAVGSLTLEAGSTLAWQSGTVAVSGGAFDVPVALHIGDAGRSRLELLQGAVLRTPGVVIGVHGALAGDGVVEADLINGGRLEPAGLRIGGFFQQMEGATLAPRLDAGAGRAVGCELLLVDHGALLGGGLHVAAGEATAQACVLLRTADLGGWFSKVEGPPGWAILRRGPAVVAQPLR